jgi:hypothetical protein
MTRFAVEARRRFRGVLDPGEYWLRAGAVMGVAAIGVQELADFSLQIPGVSLLFVIVCAMAVHAPAGVAAGVTVREARPS